MEPAAASGSSDLCVIPSAKITIGKELAHGSEGVVYKAQYTGMPVCVKVRASTGLARPGAHSRPRAFLTLVALYPFFGGVSFVNAAFMPYYAYMLYIPLKNWWVTGRQAII